MNKHLAFVFPGQGSQTIGMGQRLAEAYPIASETFEQADDLLGFPLSKIAWEGPEADLNDTINTQPALFVHAIATLRVLQQQRPDYRPAFVAGHSMGELSALVIAGSLSFPDGLRLVRRRGELMRQAGERNPGGMAAVLGLDIPTLEALCVRASTEHEPVQVANDNCPGQVVISGASAAIKRAIELAREAGARRVVRLAVSIAAHSPLMRHAQEHFNLAVDQAPLKAPQVRLIGNVSATPLESIEAVRADLKAQLTSRVRWSESIQWMQAHGVTHFLELGPGSVLAGLIRRIDRNLHTAPLGEPEDLERLD